MPGELEGATAESEEESSATGGGRRETSSEEESEEEDARPATGHPWIRLEEDTKQALEILNSNCPIRALFLPDTPGEAAPEPPVRAYTEPPRQDKGRTPPGLRRSPCVTAEACIVMKSSSSSSSSYRTDGLGKEPTSRASLSSFVFCIISDPRCT